MEVNNSSQALLNPGEADDFFEIEGLEDFNPKEADGFYRMNALWLSEFSRLIYRQEKDEIPSRSQDFRTRSSFLANKGWQEDTFFNKQRGVFLNAQASIFSNNDLEVAVLVFRGTLGLADMIIDVLFEPKDWAGTGKVHEGFSEALELAWGSIKENLAEIRFPVFFTGHSLGAALATLAVGRCLHDEAPLRPAALYTFGSPRVGDARFADALQ